MHKETKDKKKPGQPEVSDSGYRFVLKAKTNADKNAFGLYSLFNILCCSVEGEKISINKNDIEFAKYHDMFVKLQKFCAPIEAIEALLSSMQKEKNEEGSVDFSKIKDEVSYQDQGSLSFTFVGEQLNSVFNKINTDITTIQDELLNKSLSLEEVLEFCQYTKPYQRFFSYLESMGEWSQGDSYETYQQKVNQRVSKPPHCFDKFYRDKEQIKSSILLEGSEITEWQPLTSELKAWFFTINYQTNKEFDRTYSKAIIDKIFPFIKTFYGDQSESGISPTENLADTGNKVDTDIEEYYYLSNTPGSVDYYYSYTLGHLGLDEIDEVPDQVKEILDEIDKNLTNESIRTYLSSQGGLIRFVFKRTYSINEEDFLENITDKLVLLIGDEHLFDAIINSQLSEKIEVCYDLGKTMPFDNSSALDIEKGSTVSEENKYPNDNIFSNTIGFLTQKNKNVNTLMPNECKESKKFIYLGIFQIISIMILSLVYIVTLIYSVPFWKVLYAIKGGNDFRIVLTTLLGIGSLSSGICSTIFNKHSLGTFVFSSLLPVLMGLFFIGFSWHLVAYATWWSEAQIIYHGLTDPRIIVAGVSFVVSSVALVSSMVSLSKMGCVHSCMKRISPHLFETDHQPYWFRIKKWVINKLFSKKKPAVKVTVQSGNPTSSGSLEDGSTNSNTTSPEAAAEEMALNQVVSP